MALSIDYVLDPLTASATLSRTINRPYTVDATPDDVVPLDVGLSTYAYNDGVEGQTYGFKITVTDSQGGVSTGDPFNMVYIEDTGPGKQNVITRGYYDFGVYEFLTTEEFGDSPMGVRDWLAANGFPNMRVGMVGPTTGWYKCLVEGKIIFIPQNFYLDMGVYITGLIASTLTNSGLVSSGGGAILNFATCPIVTINGRQYKWRGAKHWTGGFSDIVPKLREANIIKYDRKTETDMLLALSLNDKPGYDPALIGNLPQGQTYPPFNAGDMFTAFGYSTDSGLSYMGNSNFPNGGFANYLNTLTKWEYGYSDSRRAKIVPVLELLP